MAMMEKDLEEILEIEISNIYDFNKYLSEFNPTNRNQIVFLNGVYTYFAPDSIGYQIDPKTMSIKILTSNEYCEPGYLKSCDDKNILFSYFSSNLIQEVTELILRGIRIPVPTTTKFSEQELTNGIILLENPVFLIQSKIPKSFETPILIGFEDYRFKRGYTVVEKYIPKKPN